MSGGRWPIGDRAGDMAREQQAAVWVRTNRRTFVARVRSVSRAMFHVKHAGITRRRGRRR